jgi:hypothetical protein
MPAYGDGRARAGCPRARRSPLEGGADPRARRGLLEGGAPPRTGRSPPEGGVCPRAGRSLFEGIFEWAALVGCQATVVWAMPCVLKQGAFGLGLLRVLSGDSPVVLRGPLGLSPTVAPEHLWVRHQGSRRCWSLLIGRPSLLVLRTPSVGPRQWTRGSSPQSPTGARALL